MGRVAVVGAGISGLACARTLREHGVDAIVFDKARGSGGRISTRRGEGVAFDHGAQYFTAREPRFSSELEAWLDQGIAGEWTGSIVSLRDTVISPTRTTRRFVGVPGMSSIARSLASGCSLQPSFEVAGLIRDRAHVAIAGSDGRRESGFDVVVLATPAPQAARLAEVIAPELASRARAVPFAPCWAVMLAFDSRLPTDFDGAFVDDSPLSWVARDSSKPQRPSLECWVLHASPVWSRAHLDDDPEAVIRELSTALASATGVRLPDLTVAAAHRWAFALPPDPLADRFLFDPVSGVGACGDWCAGPRVEGAFLSGVAMAERLLQA